MTDPTRDHLRRALEHLVAASRALRAAPHELEPVHEAAGALEQAVDSLRLCARALKGTAPVKAQAATEASLLKAWREDGPAVAATIAWAIERATRGVSGRRRAAVLAEAVLDLPEAQRALGVLILCAELEGRLDYPALAQRGDAETF